MRKGILMSLCGFVLCTGISKAVEREFNFGNVKSKTTEEEIKIDGLLKENFWKEAKVFKDFWLHSPVDNKLDPNPTEIRVSYDETNLYIAAICFDDNSENVIQSLKRDGESYYWRSDAIAVILDPGRQMKTGFFFGVNAAGAKLEAALAVNGSWTSMDVNWNAVWDVQVSRSDDRYIAEFSIPFSSLRFDPSKSEWGINFLRNNMKHNTYSTLTKFPINFQGVDLGHTASVQMENLPSRSAKRFTIIPSVLGGINRNIVDNEAHKLDQNIGLDAKMAVTSSLSLDVTLNPDFSQADADEQVTNLSRFSISLPEKRNFFLENSDLFRLGTGMVKPINTRKIGLLNGAPVPIHFGARLSGNVTERFRMGIMNVQTGEKDGQLAQNYSVITGKVGIFERSEIKFYEVNRLAYSDGSFLDTNYNSLAGAELNLLSSNGKWRGMAIYMKSFVNDNPKETNYFNLGGSYNSRNYRGEIWLHRLEKDFTAEVGFTPRLYQWDAANSEINRHGFYQYNTTHVFRKYGEESSPIKSHSMRISSTSYFNESFDLNENKTEVQYYHSRKDRNDFLLRAEYNQVNLLYPYTFVSDDTKDLLPVGNYEYFNGVARFMSDSRKKFSYNIGGQYGGFYNGTKLNFNTNLKARVQPWGNFSVNYRYDKLMFPSQYGERELHLVGARMEIAFSKELIWSSYLQYNTFYENFNLNSRVQWRYRPMSDVFVVFSDNVNTQDFSQKNYGLILKLNYYFNT